MQLTSSSCSAGNNNNRVEKISRVELQLGAGRRILLLYSRNTVRFMIKMRIE